MVVFQNADRHFSLSHAQLDPVRRTSTTNQLQASAPPFLLAVCILALLPERHPSPAAVWPQRMSRHAAKLRARHTCGT